jgi:SNF2 family DNA or RNA helicase
VKVFPEHRRIVLPYRADVDHVLPVAQKFQAGGAWWLAVPHTVDVVRLLRNLGLNAPSPISYYYDWTGGTPFDSQRVTADMCSIARRAYVLSEMGVGKTRAVLWVYDYLRREGLLHKLLVVAPLSTLVTVWQNEIFENFPHLETRVLHAYSKARRLRELAQSADVYIVNHDGVEVIHQELFARADIDGAVIDELASYRNRRTNRWKYVEPIVRRSNYAWGLTGSAINHAPTDAYGQSRLLTPALAGFSFKAFKDRTMRQVSNFTWVPRPEANDIAHGILQPAVRFTRAECFDLPPTTYSSRAVGLSPAATKAYKEMHQQLATQIRKHEITAANEGVKLSKLLQIAAGFAYDAGGKGRYVGGTDRFQEIIDLIEASSGKVIVFAPFRYMVELLNGVLSKKFTVAMIHGDVSPAKRTEIFAAFQSTNPDGSTTEPRVIAAHPQTMSHGLTLTAANTIIWASPPTSLETFQQANARITRVGQTQNTHIVMIGGTPIEAKVYAKLKRHASAQGALLELFEEQTRAI